MDTKRSVAISLLVCDCVCRKEFPCKLLGWLDPDLKLLGDSGEG